LTKGVNLLICFLRYSCSVVLLAALLACLLLSTGYSAGEQGTSPEERQVGELISHYFKSWSKPDMQAYESCFHPQASIYFIDPSGKPHYSPLNKFIAGEKKSHRSPTEPPIEKPTQSSVEVQGRIAHATVRWELIKGRTSVTGTDYFTFLKTDPGWRILTLVYESDKK